MKGRKRKDLGWKERLVFAVVGAVVALYDYGQLAQG